jgi:hypothetical protein
MLRTPQCQIYTSRFKRMAGESQNPPLRQRRGFNTYFSALSGAGRLGGAAEGWVTAQTSRSAHLDALLKGGSGGLQCRIPASAGFLPVFSPRSIRFNRQAP